MDTTRGGRIRVSGNLKKKKKGILLRQITVSEISRRSDGNLYATVAGTQRVPLIQFFKPSRIDARDWYFREQNIYVCVCVRAARGRPGAKAFFAGKKNERAGTRTKESRRRPVAP